MIIKLDIPGQPIAQARPRFFIRKGKEGANDSIGKYSPQETEAGRWLLSVRQQLNNQGCVDPVEDTLFVWARFFMRRPKSHYGTGRNANILKSWTPELHDKTPDLDNLEKFAWDCLKGEAWVDDRQVAWQDTAKIYCGLQERPRTEIKIYPLSTALQVALTGTMRGSVAGDIIREHYIIQG